MKILAIELSSARGSVALIENGATITEESWTEDFKNRQQLFDALAGFSSHWNDIDLFAVGRGPGAFSGLRIAFSVAAALAAPGKKPLYALNSGAAIAAQAGTDRLAVVGDARRGKVWAGLFENGELKGEFQLLEREALADFVPDGVPVASPDRDRLEELLRNFRTLDDSPVFPMAGKLGECVARRLERGIASEPQEPLYMHPPVFVAPRFP